MDFAGMALGIPSRKLTFREKWFTPASGLLDTGPAFLPFPSTPRTILPRLGPASVWHGICLIQLIQPRCAPHGVFIMRKLRLFSSRKPPMAADRNPPRSFAIHYFSAL